METILTIYLPIGFMIALKVITLHAVVTENRWNRQQAERIKAHNKRGK
jgi:hypothetical protein